MMANQFPEFDFGSALGDDILWLDSLFQPPPPPPSASMKRAPDYTSWAQNSSPSGLNIAGQNQQDHIDPRRLCCCTCPDEPVCPDPRPSKRRASAQKVAEYHATSSSKSQSDPTQSTDGCLDSICEGCNFDLDCSDLCALPCPGDTACSPEDACWDPHCDQGSCFEECVNPECTKVSCPHEPCFCQKCDTEPCPLDDLEKECHIAHSAPTNAGTIYCYDSAPCHFQNGYQISHGFPTSASVQCTSQEQHTSSRPATAAQTASDTTTPVLSPGNYTSLDGFSEQSTPAPGLQPPQDCLFDIPFDHCHWQQPCCHGYTRACEATPLGWQDQLNLWDFSLTSSGTEPGTIDFNVPEAQFTNTLPFHLGSHSALQHTSAGDTFLNLDTATWLSDPHFSNSESLPDPSNKLDFLASAIQSEALAQSIIRPKEEPIDTPSGVTSRSTTTAPSSGPEKPFICKWQDGVTSTCNEVFNDAEALHKHTKSAHVTGCTSCYCQWEGCEANEKDFKQRSKLSRHLLIHANFKPHACSFPGCNKTFATNQAKDNHERTHTGDKPYVCDKCGYTTTTHSQLQTHIAALHLGKKKHKCRFCGFTCADSSNLSKHERTHQTLRPYRCPHPGCTYKPDFRWENLKRHFRRSGHCPELLEEGDELKKYKDEVRKEIENWNIKHGSGAVDGVKRRVKAG